MFKKAKLLYRIWVWEGKALAEKLRFGLVRWRLEILARDVPIINVSTPQDTKNTKQYEEYEEYEAQENRPTVTPNIAPYYDYDDFTTPNPGALTPQQLPEAFRAMKNSRVVELFIPLLTVAQDNPEALNNIIEYAKTVYEEQKDDEATSIEAEILKAILRCKNDVEGNLLLLKFIVATFNEDRDKSDQYKSQKVSGLVLRLGFKKKRSGKGGYTGFVWDTSRLRKLCNRYGFNADLYLDPEPAEALTDAVKRTVETIKTNKTINIDQPPQNVPVNAGEILIGDGLKTASSKPLLNGLAYLLSVLTEPALHASRRKSCMITV